MDDAAVLAAYDKQVRQNLEPDGTGAVFEAVGTVIRRLARPGHDGSGVLWSDLDAVSADAVIAAQVAFFAARSEPFEWKLYSHDQPADLGSRLLAAGLVADEAESLMIGEVTEVLDALRTAEPPAGVSLRAVTTPAGVDLVARVHELVFGTDESERRAALLEQLSAAPGMTELVVAMAGGQAVCAGRIDFPPGTEFAGLWGGGTLPQWRRRGLYRALVRYRAEIAAGRGRSYLTVDASDQSRPILERVGFSRLAVTTPYNWSPGQSATRPE